MATPPKKTVCVLGGAGYIGSHVCKQLALAGFLPVCLDDLSAGHKETVRWGPFEQCNVLDAPRLGDVFAHYQPAAVFHLAARIAVHESVVSPWLHYQNNLGGMMVVLEQMQKHRVNRIIFSSSAAVYGIPQQTPIPEEHALAPTNPYGYTKMCCERLLQDYTRAGHAKNWPLQWMALRYFNAAGADPAGEIGEKHDPETHLLPLVVRAVLQCKAVTLFGDDYDTPDGTAVRDYVHVADIAKAHVLALYALEKNRPSQAYNLGNGQGSSVREVIDKVAEVTHTAPIVNTAPRREGDPPVLVAKIAAAKKNLGWQPQRSQLGTMIEDVLRWEQSSPSPMLDA